MDRYGQLFRAERHNAAMNAIGISPKNSHQKL
jgi:hypothetical protein